MLERVAEMALRLAVACVLGGAVGWEREKHDRPAGFRTHVLVCVGSATYMMVSVFFTAGESARVAANVATGMGFLGAGTIIRHGSVVRGLTTAASLWTVAAVGLAVGWGGIGYLLAILTTFASLLTLVLMSRIEKTLVGKRLYRFAVVRTSDARSRVPIIRRELMNLGVVIRTIEIAPTADQEFQELRLELRIPASDLQDRVTDLLVNVPGVRGIYWE
jgi:putative Mg2+ transporter-C (MgtC) family protein